MCEANLDDSINSDKFSVKIFFPLAQKDWLLMLCMFWQVTWRRIFSVACNSYWKCWGFLFIFWLVLLHLVSYLFFSVEHHVLCYIKFLMLFYQTWARVFQQTPLVIYLFLEKDVCHKDWLTYIVGTDWSSEFWRNFSRTTLFRWLSLLLRSLAVILTVLLFWIYLLLPPSICSVVSFFPFMLCNHFPVTFLLPQRGMLFNVLVFNYFFVDWEEFHDLRRMLMWVLVLPFISVMESVKSTILHPFLLFSDACAAAIAHRKHFFVCTIRMNPYIWTNHLSERILVQTCLY